MVSKSMYGLQVGKDQRNENYLNPLDEGVKKKFIDDDNFYRHEMQRSINLLNRKRRK